MNAETAHCRPSDQLRDVRGCPFAPVELAEALRVPLVGDACERTILVRPGACTDLDDRLCVGIELAVRHNFALDDLLDETMPADDLSEWLSAIVEASRHTVHDCHCLAE